LAKVFAVDRKALSIRDGLAVLGILLVTLVVITQLDQQKYFVTILLALLFVALSDPGGDFARRMGSMALFGLAGALLTALGFYVGGQAWGFKVLAAFMVTLLAGLAVRLGVHAFASGTLLNVWFIVAVALPVSYHAARIPVRPWSQALAWLIGIAMWMAFIGVVWLASRRQRRPESVMTVPGAGSPVTLTRPVVFFVLIRTVALAGSVAIAFGLHLPNADWMPIATLIAMKPSLEQSSLVGLQRLAGATLGAAVAIPMLLWSITNTPWRSPSSSWLRSAWPFTA
jgi:hypothetical protein